MPDIDQLSINISASSRNAETALDRLSKKLADLSGSLGRISTANFSREMTDAASALVNLEYASKNIDSQNLKNVASAMRSIASAANGLKGAEANLNSIVTAMTRLNGVDYSKVGGIGTFASAVTRLSNANISIAVSNLYALIPALQQLQGITVPAGLEGLGIAAAGIAKLGGKKVADAALNLPTLIPALQQLSSVTIPDLTGLGEFANALSAFGRKSTTQAIQNIPQIATAFQQLIAQLNKMPAVSKSTIQLATALGQLAQNASGVRSVLTGVSGGLRLYGLHAKTATRHTFSLTAAIGKAYATFWLLARVFRVFKASIDIAGDLKEVQNVVDHTFKNEKYKLEDFAKTAKDSYGITELTAKQAASRFQAMGSTMGIQTQQVTAANEFIAAKLANTEDAYHSLGESMADMSINLTRLTADMASFYNQDFDTVAEKMNSVFTGQTRPLRQYGIDLTQATLKEWALNNGLNANIATMSQAEKTLLRYQYVMANTKDIQGDFARTAGTWNNQVRLLKMNFLALGAVIGNGLINMLRPALVKLNAFMNSVIHAVTAFINAIGKIFGWQVEISDVAIVDPMQDAAGAAEDMEDATGGAAKNAKKLKDYLLGIDELNVFKPDEDSDGGGGGGGAGGGGGGGGASDAGSKANVRWEKYQSPFDNLYDLGKATAEALARALLNVDWAGIEAEARQFAQNLADFLNGFIDTDIFWEALGYTIAGAINTAIAFANTLLSSSGLHWWELGDGIAKMINKAVKDIHWDELGETIGNALNAISLTVTGFAVEFDAEELANGVSTAINTAFETWEPSWTDAALNNIVDKIEEFFIDCVKGIHWDTISSKLGEFFTGLELDTVLFLIGAFAFKVAGKDLTKRVFLGLLGGKIGATAVGSNLLKFSIPLALTALITWDIASGNQQSRIDMLKEKLSSLVNTDSEKFAAQDFAIQVGTSYNLDQSNIAGQMWAIREIIANFGEISSQAEEFAGKISRIFSPLGEVIDSVAEGMEKLLLGFKNADGLQAFLGFWQQVLGVALALGNPLKGIGQILSGVIVDGLFKAAKESGILKTIWDALPEGLQTFLSDAKERWDENIEKIKEFGKTIDEFFENLKTKEGFWDFITLDDSYAGSFNTFGEMLQDIGQKIEEFKEKLKSVFDPGEGGQNMQASLIGLFGGDGAFGQWFDENIGKYFEVEKWSEFGANIKSGIETKWGEFQLWWSGTAIATWWENDVLPWFGLEQWLLLGQNIYDGILQKWEEFAAWWRDTAIAQWWENDVAPWFTLEKWTELAVNIKTSIKTAWDDMVKNWKKDIKDWWDNYVEKYLEKKKWEELLKGLPSAFGNAFVDAANNAIEGLNAIIGGIVNLINAAIDKLNEFLAMLRNAAGPLAKFLEGTIIPEDGKHVEGVEIPKFVKAYASGGFIDDASLFMAGENGVPELLGTVGGKSAVAGGEEITGIRASVDNASVSIVDGLSVVVTRLERVIEAINDKDLTIGDVEIAQANVRGSTRVGRAILT